MDRIKVTYSRRNMDDKYVLTDYSVTFKSFDEAIGFIKKVRATKDIIGNPLVETV